MLPRVPDAIHEQEASKIKMCMCISKIKGRNKTVEQHFYFAGIMSMEANENALLLFHIKNGVVHIVNKSP